MKLLTVIDRVVSFALAVIFALVLAWILGNLFKP